MGEETGTWRNFGRNWYYVPSQREGKGVSEFLVYEGPPSKGYATAFTTVIPGLSLQNLALSLDAFLKARIIKSCNR